MARSVSAFLILAAFLMLSVSFAGASSVELLNFTGLQDGQSVQNFYNGSGVAATPNFGITFSTNFVGLLPASMGGSGGFGPNPTLNPYIYINNNSMGVMNVAAGFSSGLNFFYASLANETVTIWSGLNGSGTQLASITLSASCAGSVTSCIWFDTGFKFSGTAQSVTFTAPGGIQGIALADITLGQSMTAVPETSSIYLLATGLFGIGVSQIRRLIRL